jgi:ribosome maturation factor RimP
MNTTTHINQIDQIKAFLETLLESDMFLVDIRIKPTNNFKIFIDAENGLGIERCIKINRALYKLIEEAAWYPDGDFSLEVSSPGVDEPLKLLRQYHKNVGRPVEITLLDASKKEGVMTGVTEEQITLVYTEGKGKKAVEITEEIPFSNIKQTKVQIKF